MQFILLLEELDFLEHLLFPLLLLFLVFYEVDVSLQHEFLVQILNDGLEVDGDWMINDLGLIIVSGIAFETKVEVLLYDLKVFLEFIIFLLNLLVYFEVDDLLGF